MPPLMLFLACASETPPNPPHDAGTDARIAAAMLPPTATVCAGTGDYDTIQDAIDGVVAGTTITVCAGTYPEDLTIRKGLTLRAGGGAPTRIRGSGSGPVIDVSTRGRVGIQGFAIRGGAAENGGGISVTNAEVSISGNTIADNVATAWGGGIWLDGASGTVSDNDVSGNEALEGGGIAVWDADVTIEGNTIHDNNCTTTDDEAYGNGAGGGGMFVRGLSAIIDNDIYGNDSADNGGGAFFYLATGEVRDNRVYSNTTWATRSLPQPRARARSRQW